MAKVFEESEFVCESVVVDRINFEVTNWEARNGQGVRLELLMKATSNAGFELRVRPDSDGLRALAAMLLRAAESVDERKVQFIERRRGL